MYKMIAQKVKGFNLSDASNALGAVTHYKVPCPLSIT